MVLYFDFHHHFHLHHNMLDYHFHQQQNYYLHYLNILHFLIFYLHSNLFNYIFILHLDIILILFHQISLILLNFLMYLFFLISYIFLTYLTYLLILINWEINLKIILFNLNPKFIFFIIHKNHKLINEYKKNSNKNT